PSISLNKVVFPAPLWPISPNSSPSRTSRSMPLTGRVAPKCFATPRSSITLLSTPGAPVRSDRTHVRMPVDDARTAQQRELPRDKAQRLHRRAVEQQLHE